MFLQHLVEQAYNVVKSERKPRRNVQYRDVGESTPSTRTLPVAKGLTCLVYCAANAVARVENLEFLTDVVPKTVPYKQVKQKQTKESAQGNGVSVGQGTLDGHVEGGREEQATNGARDEGMEVEVDVDGEEEGPEEADEEEVDEEAWSPEPKVAEGGQMEADGARGCRGLR